MAVPYEKMPPVASFSVSSPDFLSGGPFAPEQYSAVFGVPGGRDESPALSWSGAPQETKSFAVTLFDPDAPIPSGFWHWGLVDLPPDTDGLPAGAGAPDAKLPGAAFHLPMEAGLNQFVGAAPPAGTGRHRYVFAVHALDVESVRDLGVNEKTTLAVFHFLAREHTLARGIVEAWGSADEGNS
jgi:Raf kinase inhibitor-like YbhB/YbcL family protein